MTLIDPSYFGAPESGDVGRTLNGGAVVLHFKLIVSVLYPLDQIPPGAPGIAAGAPDFLKTPGWVGWP